MTPIPFQVHCVCAGQGFPVGAASSNRMMLMGRALRSAGVPFHVWHMGSSFFPGNTQKKGEQDGVTWEYLSPSIHRPANRATRYFYFLYGMLLLPLRLWPVRKTARAYLFFSGGPHHLWALACCRLLGIPTAQECCEWWPGTPQETRLKRWMYRSIMFRWTQGALPISSPIETRIRQNARTGYPLLKVPILVDSAKVLREKDNPPATPGSEKPYLFWCGVVDEYLPDALFLIRVLAQLPAEVSPLRLILAGPCGEKSRQALNQAAQEAGLTQDQWTLTGFIPEDELFRLAAHARACLLPLWNDDRSQTRFPTKLGLFGAAGRPVVTCPIGEIPFFLKDMESALFAPPGDAKAWAAAITRLSQEKGLSAKLSQGLHRDFLPRVEFENLGPLLGDWFANLSLRPKPLVKPNFFILGAPKCGTTALASYLEAHPGVFFSPIKEPHYFSPDLSPRGRMDLKTYLSLFRRAEPRIHSAIGEGSTHYLFSPGAVPEILRFNPEAKFIVMLRNPLDLVQAWHAENLFEGIENLTDFEQAWRAQADRKRGKNIPFSCLEPIHLQYGAWGLLGEQMERVASRVRPEALKVILLEDFQADPAQVYRQVLAFLGAAFDGRTEFKRVNVNKKVLWHPLQLLLGLLSQMVWRAKKSMGVTRKTGLFQALLSLNSRKEKRPALPESLKAEMVEFYRDDIRKLSRLLNRDLSHWL